MKKLLRNNSGPGTLTQETGILIENCQECAEYSDRKSSNRW